MHASYESKDRNARQRCYSAVHRTKRFTIGCGIPTEKQRIFSVKAIGNENVAQWLDSSLQSILEETQFGTGNALL
jgi:hypothetical protein